MDKDSPGIGATVSPKATQFYHLPKVLQRNIFSELMLRDVLRCRLVCKEWLSVIVLLDVLDEKSAFTIDGRYGAECLDFLMEESNSEANIFEDDDSETKIVRRKDSLLPSNVWTHMKLRRVAIRGGHSWIHDLINSTLNMIKYKMTLKCLELINCTLNWVLIIQLITEFENLEVFVDSQDTYCWDYATFNSGISEDEELSDNQHFQESILNQQKLNNLRRLKKVDIHRSQLCECTTYLKVFGVYTAKLESLTVTTDQNWQPQRAGLFFNYLAKLMAKNCNTLTSLSTLFRRSSNAYDSRTTDEHHTFAHFLNFISQSPAWMALNLNKLKSLHLHFCLIPLEDAAPVLKAKLLPLLQSMQGLKELFIGTIFVPSGMENIVNEFVNDCQSIKVSLSMGIHINDAIGVPNMGSFLRKNIATSLTIQSFRDAERSICSFLPELQTNNGCYERLKMFQYFGKHHGFKDWNLEVLTKSFRNLVTLNLVDHNSRLDTRHVCEALATIEDEDMQLIIRNLQNLRSIQIIGNLTFLTDSALTGLSQEVCKSFFKKMQNPVLGPGPSLHDASQEQTLLILSIESSCYVGKPISSMNYLNSLVLRGLGIKITDVTAFYAFHDMFSLKKLHLYGSHQLSSTGRQTLSHKFPVAKGCDLQI